MDRKLDRLHSYLIVPVFIKHGVGMQWNEVSLHTQKT